MSEIRIKTLAGKDIINDESLLKELMALDRLNMEPIMEACGDKDYPLERRLKGLAGETTKLVAAFNNKTLIGYIEWCRDWNDVANIYLSSVQVLPNYQGGPIFRKLLRSAFYELKDEKFERLTSGTHHSNYRMLGIFKRLGFGIYPGKPGGHTNIIKASWDEVQSNRVFKNIIG